MPVGNRYAKNQTPIMFGTLQKIEGDNPAILRGRNVATATPKVSVIIPIFNTTQYIAEAIDSVLAQSFRDFELIIVDDGSDDKETLNKVIEPYLEEIIFVSQANLGIGPARNAGISTARAELIAFLDGDDIWEPGFLETQITFLEKSGYEMIYCDALHFGGSPWEGRTFMESAPSEGDVTAETLLQCKCNILVSGTLVKKQALIDAGMFENKKVRGQDFHLWVRMAKSGCKIGYQKRVLLNYRVRMDSVSGDGIQRIQREIDTFTRVKETIDLSAYEQAIVDRQLAMLGAEMDVAQGKMHLLREDFLSARKAFESANLARKSFRLNAVLWFLRFAPRTLLSLYRFRRPKETAFFPQKEK